MDIVCLATDYDGTPRKICRCRRRSGPSRASGSCFAGVQPFEFSEAILRYYPVGKAICKLARADLRTHHQGRRRS